MQNDCAEFKIRAERKAGEFLRDPNLNKGFKGNQYSGKLHDVTNLKDMGVERIQSHRWQKIASVPG